MAISLYDASVGASLQVVGALRGVLEKGLFHCRQNGLDPESVVKARLYPDRQPFSFQVRSVASLPLRAIAILEAGKVAAGGQRDAEFDYPTLQSLLSETEIALSALDPARVDAFQDKEIPFETGHMKTRFTAENFIMSFVLPNLFFHATTAYGILRMTGAPVGKLDFLGAMRTMA